PRGRSYKAFWEEIPLDQLSREQWEQLCDGCGRCCLNKLEDIDTGEIHYTLVACRLLDRKSCRCSDYANRLKTVPECLQLGPERLDLVPWMPESCAYRRLFEGRGLAPWHPLVSGDPLTVRLAGISVCPAALSEEEIGPDELEAYLIDFD
ncbi:YcgN family cysteine cluster protein, partial [Endothiovibrio diazotrophicus]